MKKEIIIKKIEEQIKTLQKKYEKETNSTEKRVLRETISAFLFSIMTINQNS